jgi:predicted anti-sigma-YlaC factor YlaD
MSCQPFREHLSADLDGEAGPGGATTTDDAYRHLESCADCARWFADATRINRLVRTAPAEPGPGFSEAQLDDLLDLLPPPAASGRGLWRQLARGALALVGLVQAALGAWSFWVPHGGPMDAHAGMMGAGMVHMSHEYSAWSIALGIAFLVGAAWTRHLAGALPVLASFVAVLLAVSVVDLINDSVDAHRVFSHGLVVLALGLVVVIVLSQPEPELRPFHGPGRVWAGHDDDAAPAEQPARDDRMPHGGTSEPAARHRAA